MECSHASDLCLTKKKLIYFANDRAVQYKSNMILFCFKKANFGTGGVFL